MLPISPIISSIIAFLQTQTIANAKGAITILEMANNYITKPTTPQIQLIFFSFIIPLLSLSILVFPFSFRNPIADILLSFLLGFLFNSLYTHRWYIFLGIVCVVGVYVVVSVFVEYKKKKKKEDLLLIVKDLRDYYMEGICEDGGCSCVEIDNRVESYLSVGEKTKGQTIANFVCFFVLGIGTAIACVAKANALLVVILATLSFLFFVFGIMTVNNKIARGLSSVTLRAAIVILEALYIPGADLVSKILHPVAYCNMCTIGKKPFILGDTSTYNCTTCNTGWHLSPFGFPGMDYKDNVLLSFLPFCVFIIIVYVIGLPYLEWRMCKSCCDVLLQAGTVGGDKDDVYAETLSSLHSPAIYTFFIYKRQYIFFLPPIFLFLKITPPILSHLQEIYTINYILPSFFLLLIIIIITTRPYIATPCLVLEIIMHACNIFTSLLPIFTKDIPRAIYIALTIASACTPIVGWLVVFVILQIRKKKRERKEEIEVDGFMEDGEVVRERIDNLYVKIDKLIGKMVINLLVVYGLVFGIAGGISCGYYFGYYLFK